MESRKVGFHLHPAQADLIPIVNIPQWWFSRIKIPLLILINLSLSVGVFHQKTKNKQKKRPFLCKNWEAKKALGKQVFTHQSHSIFASILFPFYCWEWAELLELQEYSATEQSTLLMLWVRWELWEVGQWVRRGDLHGKSPRRIKRGRRMSRWHHLRGLRDNVLRNTNEETG